MKDGSIRKLGISLFILSALLYLAFSPRTHAQDGTEGKKPNRVSSIMTFDPSSRGSANPAVEPEIAPESIVADTVGTNVDASNETGAQSETDIAIDPTNPNHIIGGSNDINTGFMRVYESSNGGSSWTNTAMPLPPSPNNAFTSDPAVAFDSAGNAYYSYLGVSNASATTLVCSKKAAGASSWGTPVVVPNVNADKNLMTVDRTGGTFNNRIYIGWDNNNATSQSLMVARSSDGGASFTATKVNNTGTTVIGADPAIGPNGEVYVVWSNYASASHNLFINRSTDGGVTWGGTDNLVHHWVAATGSGLDVTIPADPQRGVTVFGFIDVDRTTGPNRGTIYCVYNDATTSNGLDIFLRKSTNGGATWSAAVRVNDDPTGVVHDQFLPRVAVDQSDGSVNIMWDDTRNDPNNKKTDIYYTRSTDGGNTFATNTKVTTAQSDESLSGRDANGYGDYNGIAASGGTVRPLWTDSRSGSEEVYTAAITNAAPAPDFSMSVSPSSQSVTQGSSTSYTVSTSALNGFTGSVSLSVSGLPSGATSSFSANPVTAGSSSTLTVSTTSTTSTGTFSLTFTGTSGSLTHTATASLTVNSAATPNMTLSVSPTSLSINQGSSGSVTATTTVSGGFNSAVSLSASGMPSGVTAAFNPTSIAAPGGGNSTLTLTASSTATTGTATVTVTASGGGITRTATVSLTVNASGGTTNSQLIVNGGFESGTSPWVYSGNAYFSTGAYPHSGTAYSLLGTVNFASGYVYQQITIPSTATAATMNFWLNVTTQETTTSTVYDTMNVNVYNSSGSYLATVASYSNLSAAADSNTPGVYVQKVGINLLAYKGQTILLAFFVNTDSSLPTTFRIDDIAVNVTATAHQAHHNRRSHRGGN